MADLDLMEMLRRSGGLDAVSKQLGVPPAVAAAGADALLPILDKGQLPAAERRADLVLFGLACWARWAGIA